MNTDFSRGASFSRSLSYSRRGWRRASDRTPGPRPGCACKGRGGGTPQIINLGANTLSIGPSKKALEAIAKYAPMSGGYERSETGEFAAIVSKQLGVPADHISVYPGSGTPLDLVVMAFTGPKGSLVTADPTYEQGWRTSQRSGAKLIKVRQRKDFSHNVEAMCAADPNMGMLYICNPNNPTGAITMRKDIEYAVKNMPKGCTLVVDEAYIHFSENAKTAADLVAAGENVVVLRTFSKLLRHGRPPPRLCGGQPCEPDEDEWRQRP